MLGSYTGTLGLDVDPEELEEDVVVDVEVDVLVEEDVVFVEEDVVFVEEDVFFFEVEDVLEEVLSVVEEVFLEEVCFEEVLEFLSEEKSGLT